MVLIKKKSKEKKRKGKKKRPDECERSRRVQNRWLSFSSTVFTLRFSCSEASSALLAPVSRSRGDGTWYAPPYHTWAAIRRNDSPSDKFRKFVNRVEEENDATWKTTSLVSPLRSRWYFESSSRESLIITLVITIPFIIRGRFDGWHYSKDKRAFVGRHGCGCRLCSSCVLSEGGFKWPEIDITEWNS